MAAVRRSRNPDVLRACAVDQSGRRPSNTNWPTSLARSIPQRHLQFLDALDLSFSCGDFLFVHAGIRPGVPIRRQREEDLLWIRDEFLFCEQPFEKFVVHGHTPVPAPDIRSNRVNIDTGAFATGRLTCIAIEGTSIAPLIDVRDWARGDGGVRPRSRRGPTSGADPGDLAARSPREPPLRLGLASLRHEGDGLRSLRDRVDPSETTAPVLHRSLKARSA